MSFDISRLTSAVNKYLNSISDIGRQAAQQSQEIADKAQFQADLSEAIKANIQSKTRDIDTIPDIGAMVQNEVKSATAGIDATFEQINGAFLEISEAGKSTSLGKDNQTAVSATDKSGNDAASGSGNKSDAGTEIRSGNADAYAGRLSTEALKELSSSGYFSGNMIASSLFKTDDEDSTGSSSVGTGTLSSLSSALTSAQGQNAAAISPFEAQSLDQLNVNSLLANSLGVSTTASDSLTSALKAVANSTSNTDTASAASTTSALDAPSSNDLAKALIKAYTSAAKTTATTSVFGDFSL